MSEKEMKFLSYYTIAAIYLILFATEFYGLALVATLYIGFFHIVVLSKKYRYLKDYMDQFF